MGSHRPLGSPAACDYLGDQEPSSTLRQNLENFPTGGANVEKAGYLHDDIAHFHFYHAYTYRKKPKYLVMKRDMRENLHTC